MTKRSYRDIYHGEIVKMLHRHHIWTRSQETGKFSQTEPGSADVMAHLNGGCAIEIKTGFAGTFRFSDWRENQRVWALDYEAQTHNLYWLAVMFETETCPWKALHKPRIPYLIPLVILLETIAFIPQNSFPAIVGKGMPLFIQENQLDAAHLWKNYQLDRDGEGWCIPQCHPFFTRYISMEKPNE